MKSLDKTRAKHAVDPGEKPGVKERYSPEDKRDEFPPTLPGFVCAKKN